MFSKQLDAIYSRHNLYLWFLLLFQAGIINVGGFLAAHRFVSHVTGFATHVGVEFFLRDWKAFFGMLAIPLFFLLGAMVSGYFIDRRRQEGKEPWYVRVMVLIALSFFLSAFLGQFGYFGEFGSSIHTYRTYFLLALLCAACGLQNALITTASGAVIRTTHLTGITTDLGIGLVRVFSWKNKEHKYQQENFANWFRLGAISSFFLGSVIGAFLFDTFQYVGFYLPMIISIFIAARLRHRIRQGR